MRMKSIKRIQKYPPERKLIAGEKQNNVGLFQIIVFTVRVKFTARVGFTFGRKLVTEI